MPYFISNAYASYAVAQDMPYSNPSRIPGIVHEGPVGRATVIAVASLSVYVYIYFTLVEFIVHVSKIVAIFHQLYRSRSLACLIARSRRCGVRTYIV